MNVLEKIKISYGQLITMGADHSYSAKVVRRFWGDKEELSLQKILDKKVHPHLITWTLLHETVLPPIILHQVALLIAKKFIAKYRKENSCDADILIDDLLRAKELWLNNKINDRDSDVWKKKAEEMHDWYLFKIKDKKVAKVAAVLRDLQCTLTDTADCIFKVYYNTIDSASLTSELVPEGRWSEEWDERLLLVRNLFESLADVKVKDAFNLTQNDKSQFIEWHYSQIFPQKKRNMQIAVGETPKKHLPVGTIIAYAGDTARDEEPAGWMLCDGRELNREDYNELFEKISTAWGSSYNKSFNIPDLRGTFLRGCKGAKSINPDASSRKKSKEGGNEGDKVGTYQDYATKVPTKAFTATISNGNTKKDSYDAGCQSEASTYDESSTTVEITKGGGKETRPQNKAIHYLIKYASIINNKYVETPLAAVFPFAGKDDNIDKSYWRLCNGEQLSNAGDDEPLFKIVKFIHGGANENEYFLPDFQDMFLRGVTDDPKKDPDYASRTSPKKGEKPGNNLGVGSMQNEKTARPKNNFTISVNVPTSKIDKVIENLSRDLYQFNEGATETDLSTGGGDDKTLPVYKAVNWVILKNKIQEEQIPVGTVIAFGGDKLDNKLWKLCNGEKVLKKDYPDLVALLQETGTEETFNLPDYSGYFLCGASENIPVGYKNDVSTTKLPEEHFKGDILHLPSSTISISGVTRHDGALDNGNATMGSYTGGDNETRPRNHAVNYYIRVLNPTNQ